MAIQDAFIWGAGGKKLTPEEAARRRQVENALLEKGVDFSPVGHWTQGLARVADAAAGAFRRYDLSKGEKEIADVNKGLIANLLAGRSGAASPASSSAIPMSGAAGEIAATGPEAYRNAIASIESAGSGDYSAIGPTNDKLGRALGRYQIMEANIGPWSQEALGRAVTPEEFLADPALQDAIFDAKFGQYVNQFGPEGAAQAWFAGPGGVGKTGRKDVLGTTVGDYGQKFVTALGASPSTSPAAAAIDAVAPTEGPQLAADFSGSNQLSNAQGGIVPALVGGMPASPDQIARAQAAAQEPIEVAGGGDRVPMASSSTGINPAIIEALTNPQASPQTQRLAGILLEQEQARQNALMEQQAQANDPLRKLQLEKGQLEIDALRNPVPDFRQLTADEIAQRGLDPKKQYQISRDNKVSQIGDSGTNVSVTMGGEPSDNNLRKKLDEKTGELWSTYQEQGATSAAAAQDFGVLDELIKVAPQGPIQGRLAEMFPGVSSAGDAFQSIVKRVAPTLRAPGSGATSDIEYDGMLKSLPALRNKPEANQAINAVMKAKAAINVERSSVIDQYGRGEITAGEARSKIAEIDKKSIMSPELKKALEGIGATSDSNATPTVGEVIDGYRFKGGDPADQNSWERQ